MNENSKYFDFPLKPQQEKAFAGLQQFVESNSNKIFILKGYAGSGKTTLMSGFIKWLNDKEIIYSLLASTGRAAKYYQTRQILMQLQYTAIYTSLRT